VWRTTPAWAETWKDTSPASPTTSSVDPPPISITTSASVTPSSRSAVAPRNVSLASVSPPIVRASSA
jgi:hypothetical protein